MTDKTTMGVKLDGETRDRLRTLGKARDRSPHYLMREAISQYLAREEAREQERQITLDRWDRYQRTGEAIDHASAAAWMRSLTSGDVRGRPNPSRPDSEE